MVFKSCCCFTVRTGSLIMGYLGLIFSCITLGKLTMLAADRDPIHDPLSVVITSLAVSVLCVASSAILVIGVHMDKPVIVRVHLIGTLILFAVSVVGIIVVAVMHSYVLAIFIPIAIGFKYLYLMVIYSTYLEMKQKQNPQNHELHNHGTGGPQQA